MRYFHVALHGTRETTARRTVRRETEASDNEIEDDGPNDGRITVTMAKTLVDYSRTMGMTDHADAARSRITTHVRRAHSWSRHVYSYLIFGVAMTNAWILWRGLDANRWKTIRAFAEAVIEQTIRPFDRGEVDCWLLRVRKRKRRTLPRPGFGSGTQGSRLAS